MLLKFDLFWNSDFHDFSPPKINEIILHLRFKETDATLQQETLGVLGVNLIYGAFYLNDSPKELLGSLYDNLSKDKLEIDMINFSGPRFMYVDNRLMSLLLVKNGMTDAVMFNFKVLHSTLGNTEDKTRKAFSARFIGDDVRYIDRKGETSPPFKGINLKNGDKMREDWFPKVWVN